MIGIILLCVLGISRAHPETAVENVVAFTAELSAETLVGTGSTIIFDRVLSNYGERYVSNLGTFVCPDNGTYVFMWSIQSPTLPRERDQGRAKLVMGDEDIKLGPVTTITTSGFDYAGTSQMSVVTKCQENLTVRVQALPYQPGTEFSVFSPNTTSFTGFRIAENDVTAFSAQLGNQTNVFPDQTVFYDDVLLNTGNFYLSNQGNFVCPPNNDTYVFTWSIEANENTRAKVALVSGGEEIILGPVTSMTNFGVPSSGSTSMTAIIKCFVTNAVWVQTRQNPPFPFNQLRPQTTSFNGYRIASSTYSFTATLTAPQPVVQGDAVIFNNVVSNEGGAYNSDTGVFLCVENGAYLFTWSIHINVTRAFFHLERDGEVLKEGPSTNYANENGVQMGTGSSSTAVVIQCDRGQEVTIRAAQQNYDTIVLLEDLNSFSGFRLTGVA